MQLTLRRADAADVPRLARMNKHLIEDEGSSNPMNLAELEARMKAWLRSDWQIDLICRDAEIVGYALYRFREDPYFPDREEVYLRQYFIERDERRHGFGIDGIRLLQETRFGPQRTVVVDVLENNERGLRFWEKAGFLTYARTMMLRPDQA